MTRKTRKLIVSMGNVLIAALSQIIFMSIVALIWIKGPVNRLQDQINAHKEFVDSTRVKINKNFDLIAVEEATTDAALDNLQIEVDKLKKSKKILKGTK